MSEKDLIALRIDPKVNEKLVKLATMLDRSKSWIIRQSIETYVDEINDFIIAEERLRDPDVEYVKFDDLKKELNIS